MKVFTSPSMKNILKVYIVCAIIIVILYSPGLLALSPFSTSFLKQGFSIIFGVLFFAYLGWYTYRSFHEDNYHHLEDTSKESIVRAEEILTRYAGNQKNLDTYKIASSGLSELNSVKSKRKMLTDIVNSKFAKGSLTNDRFMGTIELASNTIEKNTILLANYLQSLDEDEFRKLKNSIATGSYKNDNIDDNIQEEKFNLFLSRIEEMNNINAANEKLLLELDKFSAEISKLDISEVDASSEEMIKELNALSEEAKYYN